MPYYENIFIARQDVTSAQVEGLVEHFAGIVAAQGGNETSLARRRFPPSISRDEVIRVRQCVRIGGPMGVNQPCRSFSPEVPPASNE